MQVLGAAAVLMVGASAALADTITQAAPFVGNDNTGVWSSITPTPGGAGLNNVPNTVSNGSSIATTNDTVSIAFSQAPTNQGEIVIAGTSWNGDGWTPGTYLLSSHYGPGSDTLTLTFATAVSAFGIYVQDLAYDDPFTASIYGTYSSGAGGGNSPTFTVVDNALMGGEYYPAFLGLTDTGASIQSVTISVGSSGDDSYFAVGPPTLTDNGGTAPPSVPEPGSLMLMASGLAAVAWKLRQRSRA